MTVLMNIIGIVLKGLATDEDDDDFKTFTFLYNLNLRIAQDLQFYINPNTGIDIMKSITPVTRTITDVVSVTRATQKWILKEDYQGDHPAYKALKLIPGLNQIPKTNSLMERVFDKSYSLDDYIMDQLNEDELN